MEEQQKEEKGRAVIELVRRLRLPDARRVALYQRAPELGPQLLFFSGGSALRKISRELKRYTHNSIHLITPFDSGGSSAHLREAFRMLAVGDLRNRLMALAEESVTGNPAIYRLFSHRFDKQGDPIGLGRRLQRMVEGQDPLILKVPEPLRHLICGYLQQFTRNMPPGFDLRGASIGNLVLAGGYISHNRNIDAVIFLFSQLVEVRGLVQPVVDVDMHLAADLEDGTEVVGQHLLTGKEHAPLASPVTKLHLVETLEDPRPAQVTLPPKVHKMIIEADVLCFPIGSFYSSVLANLLPTGVGRAVKEAVCPKVYIPNLGIDPEQAGMNLSRSVETLLTYLRQDAGEDTPTNNLLHFVLIDSQHGQYGMEMDLEATAALGVQIVDLPLASASNPSKLDPTRLTHTLLSFA